MKISRALCLCLMILNGAVNCPLKAQDRASQVPSLKEIGLNYFTKPLKDEEKNNYKHNESAIVEEFKSKMHIDSAGKLVEYVVTHMKHKESDVFKYPWDSPIVQKYDNEIMQDLKDDIIKKLLTTDIAPCILQEIYMPPNWSLDGVKKTVDWSFYKINCLAYSPDGNYLAIGVGIPEADNVPFYHKGNVIIFDVNSNKSLGTLVPSAFPTKIKQFSHNAPVVSIAYSPDGKTIASASEDGMVKLWDATSWRLKQQFKANPQDDDDMISEIAYSPNSKSLAVGLFKGNIKIWDFSLNKFTDTLKGHTQFITSIAYSPDGKYVASSSEDKKIKIWTVEGKNIKTLGREKHSIESVVYSPDNKYIISGSSGIAVWHALAGDQPIKRFGEEFAYKKIMPTFLSNKYIVTGSMYDSKEIAIWDIVLGQKVFYKNSYAISKVTYGEDYSYLVSEKNLLDREYDQKRDLKLEAMASNGQQIALGLRKDFSLEKRPNSSQEADKYMLKLINIIPMDKIIPHISSIKQALIIRNIMFQYAKDGHAALPIEIRNDFVTNLPVNIQELFDSIILLNESSDDAKTEEKTFETTIEIGGEPFLVKGPYSTKEYDKPTTIPLTVTPLKHNENKQTQENAKENDENNQAQENIAQNEELPFSDI